jgi:hypothetical protein
MPISAQSMSGRRRAARAARSGPRQPAAANRSNARCKSLLTNASVVLSALAISETERRFASCSMKTERSLAGNSHSAAIRFRRMTLTCSGSGCAGARGPGRRSTTNGTKTVLSAAAITNAQKPKPAAPASATPTPAAAIPAIETRQRREGCRDAIIDLTEYEPDYTRYRQAATGDEPRGRCGSCGPFDLVVPARQPLPRTCKATPEPRGQQGDASDPSDLEDRRDHRDERQHATSRSHGPVTTETYPNGELRFVPAVDEEVARARYLRKAGRQ